MPSTAKRRKYVKERSWRFVVEGRCMQCGKEREQKDKRSCDACLERKREYMRNRRDRWVADNKCGQCGKDRDDSDVTVLCPSCRERSRTYQTKRRLVFIAKGLCQVCGGKRDRTDRALCTDCRTYNKVWYILDKD